MGYVNKFNRGIARVQKELVENGNGKATFTVDKVTVFSVNVTNAKAGNVSAEDGDNIGVKNLRFSDKSLKILELCNISPRTKKEVLLLVGVTNQTTNVRSIINPLIVTDYLAPVEKDKSKSRNVRYEATARGQEYLRYRQSLSSSLKEESKLAPKDHPEPSLFPDFD